MKKINKKTNFLARLFFVPVVILATMIFTVATIYAVDEDSSSELNSEDQKVIEDKEEEVEELEEKAKAYEKIIKLKEKQQSSLGNQISSLNSEIGEIEADINANKGKISMLNDEIKEIEKSIDKKEKSIEAQRKMLAGIIRSYYEHNKDDSVITSILDNKGLSGFIIKRDRIVQTGDKLGDTLDNLKALKNSLEGERQSLNAQKAELIDLHYELKEKNSSLEGSRLQKEILLNQTQGEEAKYRNLLRRVEEQKQQLLGDIDNLYSANSEEIKALAKSLKKPTSGLASTSWYYSQKDSRWGSSRIGQSSSLLKDYGCAITSVAMVFTYHGEDITPKTLAKQPIFYWDLIKWPATWRSLKLVENTNHSGVSWSKIDDELDKDSPVIVYIRAGSKGGHYVVIHHEKKGKYIVHDPYWGANIYLDSSMKLLSKLYSVSISERSIDQMILYK